MKRFQITEAEYKAIKAKESATKDKNISRGVYPEFCVNVLRECKQQKLV